VYSFENLDLPGYPTGQNFEVFYFSDCPITFDRHGYDQKGEPTQVSFYINCGCQSSLFGRGTATGQYVYERNMDPATNKTHGWIVNGFPNMIFDDDVQVVMIVR
jgi:hypothetical protein